MSALRLPYLIALRGLGFLSIGVSLAYANLMPCVLACGMSVGFTPALALGGLGLGLLLAVSRWTPKTLADPASGGFRTAILVLWPAALVFVALTATYAGTFHAELYAGSTLGPLLSNAVMFVTVVCLAAVTVLGLIRMGDGEREVRESAEELRLAR